MPHKRRMIFRCFALPALLGIVMPNALAQNRDSEERDGLDGYGRWSKKEVRSQIEQIKYKKEVEAWADEEPVKRTEFLERYYRPIVEGNRKSYEKNMRKAERLREKAREVMNQNKEDQARKIARTAKLLYQCAQQNKNIVVAIEEDGDTKAMEEAFSKLKELEKQIAQIIGRWPEREWFTPDELTIAEIRLRQRENQ